MTRQRDFQAPGCTVVHSLDRALDIALENAESETFVIGGAEIYSLALAQADRLYLTEIDADIQGDTSFPAFDSKHWREVSRKHHDKDDRHAYAFDFVIYERIV